MIKERYLHLFSNVIGVNGYARSCFYDLQKNKFVLSPKELSELFQKGKISETKFSLSTKENEEDAIEFLVENGLIFHTDIPENFPVMNLSWDSYSTINNLILHSNQLSNIERINDLHNELLIQATEVVSIGGKTKLIDLNKLDGNILRSINLSIDENITLALFENIVSSNQKLTNVKLSFDDSFNFVNSIENTIKTKINIIPFDNVEKITNEFVEPSIPLFTESQKHHSYFNRKLYIGEKGEIKNAPECEEEFGSIQDLKGIEDLKKIISKPEFQKYWFIHKDLCDVCKDCEFRYMCVDNRLPYQREDGSWYHKTECNYNPYLCKFKGEDGYRSLKDSGVTVNESLYSRNDEEIAKIDEDLWAE